MIRLEPIVLVRRTIDNRPGKQLTKLAGIWMNRVRISVSVKREASQQTQTNRGNDSITSHMVTKYYIIRVYIIYLMYYITIKVALLVSGLGIIRIFYYNTSL